MVFKKCTNFKPDIVDIPVNKLTGLSCSNKALYITYYLLCYWEGQGWAGWHQLEKRSKITNDQV